MSALIFILPMPTDSVTVFVALFRCGQKTRKLEHFLPYTKRIFTKPTIYRTFIFTIEKITISQNRTKAEISRFYLKSTIAKHLTTSCFCKKTHNPM